MAAASSKGLGAAGPASGQEGGRKVTSQSILQVPAHWARCHEAPAAAGAGCPGRAPAQLPASLLRWVGRLNMGSAQKPERLAHRTAKFH